MNIGDKILIINPKTIYIGIIIRDGLKPKEVYVAYYNFGSVNFYPYIQWAKRDRVMEKHEWLKYFTQEQFDNLLLMACHTNPANRAIGKELVTQTISRK